MAKVLHRCDLVVRAYSPMYKIQLIKLTRELTGMGLAETKAFVEQPLPIRLARDLPAKLALELRTRFAPYATVTLEPTLPPNPPRTAGAGSQG